MLGYQKWGEGEKPDKKPDHFVGDFYVLYANKEKENPELLEEVKEMLEKWEQGNKKVLALWKKMNGWCYEGHKETYDKFGLDLYIRVYYESDFYDKGKNIVNKGVKKGLFTQEKDKAVFVDLGNLGKKYLIRSGGTALYVTQDLALAEIKWKTFKFDKSIYMTGNEQDYYFKQLFKIFEILDYPFANHCYHIGTGMVLLPEGKMKSREGTVVDADDLIHEMSILASNEIKKRGKKPVIKNSERIGLAAIKYHLLKTSSHKNIVFNPEESISFEGDTGPYLLYSLVRAQRILEKAESLPKKIDVGLYESEEENTLIKSFAGFEQALIDCADRFSPHILCSYAYNLASDFNSFYEKCHVLQAEDAKVRKARLLLVKAYIIIMSKALYLLGIEPVHEM
jgi:arginyl-tRNA synthetase